MSEPGRGFDPNSYGGLGLYPQSGGPADPPPRKKKWLGVVVGVLAAVIIVGGSVAIYFLLVPSSSQAAGPTGAPVTTTPSSAPTTVPTTRASAAVPPTIPGWQAVVSSKGGLAYDVPPSWKVDRPGGLVGFGTSGSPDKVTMLDDAVFRPGFCQGRAGSTRAGAGFTSVSEPDAGKAAADLARKTSIGAYSTADGSPPDIQAVPPRPMPIGAQHGFQVTANLTIKPQGPCDSPHALVTVTTLPGPGGSVALIAWADQGTPDQADPADLHRIADSLRPAR